MSPNRLNKKEDNPVSSQNIHKIDNLVVAEVEKAMRELDEDIGELDSYMQVMRDRMMASESEPSYPITLARFAELKLQSRKQKNEALKTLIAYKAEEHASRKRSSDPSSAIQDIMAGVGIGAAMASANKIDISNNSQIEEIDVVIDATYNPIEVEVEQSMDDAVLKLLESDE